MPAKATVLSSSFHMWMTTSAWPVDEEAAWPCGPEHRLLGICRQALFEFAATVQALPCLLCGDLYYKKCMCGEHRLNLACILHCASKASLRA